jgi:hypothetical protein
MVQCFTAWMQSTKREGQKYLAQIIFWVVAIPERWPPHAPLWWAFETCSTSTWVRHRCKRVSVPRR